MKAIITRNDQTAVLELPTSRMELAGSLSRIGIRTPAHIIPCSDEEEDYIKVKLFGESDFENELTALVSPQDSLGGVNTALDLYRELPQAQKEKLKAELSQNPPDSLSFLCQKVMEFQPKYVTEDYYFPLTVTVYEYNEYNSNVSRTLYAVWQKNAPTSYTVSYDANGGSGAPNSQTKTQDVTLTLSGTKPTRSGYTFLGWATSSSATSAS